MVSITGVGSSDERTCQGCGVMTYAILMYREQGTGRVFCPPCADKLEQRFDDTYDGPRWRYGMTHRPPAIGCQPEGRIILADRKVLVDGHPNVIFGTIEYARELTPKEIEAYELEDLGRVE